MPIKHIVVLMLENRSFDNVLGALYSPSNAPPYQTAPTGQAHLDGIPADATNPGPNGLVVSAHNQTGTTQTSVAPFGGAKDPPTYSPTTIPIIDPGEYFCDVAQQLLGLSSLPGPLPWSAYAPTDALAAQGYVNNYCSLSGFEQTTPPEENWADVMNYFTPAQLPVSAFLAKSYGLSDRWFSPVPSQTYVNRAFALSAAPGVGTSGTSNFSMVDDAQFLTDTLVEMPSIFSQLDAALAGTNTPAPFWKVYFHDYSITFDTLPYVQAQVSTGQNVGTFDSSDWGTTTPTQLGKNPVASSFVDDVAAGYLPPFSWIEPRYFDNYGKNSLPPNSNHPGSAAKPPVFIGTQVPIDAATGEVLLMQVYNLLRGSTLWESTLLIVTYDESCGIWDHVPPPLAPSPGSSVPLASCDTDTAANGFAFDVFGGRVPAIVVGPMVPAGSLFRPPAAGPPFDHTSIIKTVRDVFLVPQGPTAPLTGRDAAAPSLLCGLADKAVNTTGVFEGTIVAGPSSLYFQSGWLSGPSSQTVFASAGPSAPLQVSASQQPGHDTWLTVSMTGPATAPTITATADTHLLGTGSYYGQLTITSADTTVSAVQVPVRFDITVL